MITALRALEPHELQDFTEEVKSEVILRVKEKIAHLESSLAVAELTVALHYVLNTPEDVLIWDVGHQGYIHKAITGRMKSLNHQRTPGGVSGFLKRDESPFDFFGAGHASTSISALAGVCMADAIKKYKRHRIAVVGDGSFTGGQTFEALNHLGTIDTDALVILNDNDGSIDQTIGVLHNYQNYQSYFKSLGWEYHQCEEGNDVTVLVAQLQRALTLGGKRVIHVKTIRPDLSPPKSYKPGTTFQWWAAEEMGLILAANPEIQILSSAMFAGSGFAPLREKHPQQLHDTGINEPHTVTAAAGIAAAGGKAWVHIYSTFLQRAMDQVIHDIALQELPVIFLVDRAGFVGSDGPTHHGVFDLGFLLDIPNVTVWNPMDGSELQAMLRKASEIQPELRGPLFIRYPKARTSCDSPVDFMEYRFLKKGHSNTLLLSSGVLSSFAKEEAMDHVHLGQLKPLPAEVRGMLGQYQTVVILEESMGTGGLSGTVAMEIANSDLDIKLMVRKINDVFTEHGSRHELLKATGLLP